MARAGTDTQQLSLPPTGTPGGGSTAAAHTSRANRRGVGGRWPQPVVSVVPWRQAGPGIQGGGGSAVRRNPAGGVANAAPGAIVLASQSPTSRATHLPSSSGKS